MERNNIQINRESLIQFLGTERFLMVDIRFVKLFNANGALFLTNLIDKYLFMKACGKLKDNGFFYTFEQQTETIGLSLFELRGCKKKLIETGIIEIKKVGLPAKEYYFIQFNTLFELLNIGVRSVRQEVTLNGRSCDTVNGRDIIYTNLLYNDSAKPLDLPNTKRKNLPNEKIVTTQFDKFWESYPQGKKGSKGAAIKSWNNLCSKKDRPTWREIKKALFSHIDSIQWKGGIVPNASTWLNQTRWVDDPEEMTFTIQKNDPKIGTYKEISGRKFWWDTVRKDYFQNGSDERYVE